MQLKVSRKTDTGHRITGDDTVVVYCPDGEPFGKFSIRGPYGKGFVNQTSAQLTVGPPPDFVGEGQCDVIWEKDDVRLVETIFYGNGPKSVPEPAVRKAVVSFTGTEIVGKARYTVNAGQFRRIVSSFGTAPTGDFVCSLRPEQFEALLMLTPADRVILRDFAPYKKPWYAFWR